MIPHPKMHLSKASKDAIIFLAIFAVIAALTARYELFELIIQVSNHGNIRGVEESIVLLVYLVIALGYFSLHRSCDLEKALLQQKKTEEKLIQAKIAAESANLAKSEFLANMSHELRTPLNSVIGFADLLVEGNFGPLNTKQQRFVGNISVSGKHLLGLINNILDLSKVEAGDMKLEVESFAVSEVFAETRSMVIPLAFKKNILIETTVDQKLCVRADKKRFKQILYNLVSNAIKFTPEGGSVTVLAVRTGEMVRVRVSDTGIGISEEEQEYIFQPFRQVDSRDNRQYEGTGLGLTLAKKFVEMHGGRIRVESNSGKGSTFTFEIPADNERKLIASTRPAKVPERRKPGPSPETDRHGMDKSLGSEVFEPPGSTGKELLVLVVENDELLRDMLVITLNEAGYRVISAASGKEALLLARKLHPFVITLDIMMPGMNGWEVLKKLKENNDTVKIPVMVISVKEEWECSLLWGAFDHLVKPVEKHVLLSKLERLKDKTQGNSPSVLVVDDEPALVELMVAILQQGGYEPLQAFGGREAIDKTLSEAPDALVLDLMMPDFNGFEVIKVLKENPETIDIPIIVCTSKDLDIEEMETLNKNVSFIMQKGDLGKETLVNILHQVETRIPKIKGFPRESSLLTNSPATPSKTKDITAYQT
ncbi:MAG: response regulator [Methanosarcinaceae archaeon]|nr:response regulator [Methanosarcinaceae archaeon]